MTFSPYERILGRGHPGPPEDLDITDGRLSGVTGDELKAEPPLPEGSLLCVGNESSLGVEIV